MSSSKISDVPSARNQAYFRLVLYLHLHYSPAQILHGIPIDVGCACTHEDTRRHHIPFINIPHALMDMHTVNSDLVSPNCDVRLSNMWVQTQKAHAVLPFFLLQCLEGSAVKVKGFTDSH